MTRTDTRSPATKISVTILCGFLGAGKTTLLKRLLENPEGTRFGVLVNDFGEINIDAALIESTDTDQISLANGCICCSIQDDLVEAAQSILERQPEHLIVEASGVSRPLAILAALERPELADRLRIDAVLCLADADQFGNLDFASTELAIDQAVSADLLIVNKCDLATPVQIDRLEATMRGPMPGLRIIRTSFADVPRELLLGLAPRVHEGSGDHERALEPAHDHGNTCDHHHDHDLVHDHKHDHTEQYSTWSWTSEQPLDEVRFKAAVRKLPQSLLRAKGMVRLASTNGETVERRVVFHLVGKRHTIEPYDGPTFPLNQIVAIGRAGGIDAAALEQIFNRAIAT